MRARVAASLLLMLAPALLSAEEEGAPDPRAANERLEELWAEYQDLARNQDVRQRRRRREIARELAGVRHEETCKRLQAILDQDADIRARINAMVSIGGIGDLAAVKRMVATVQRESRTVLASYVGGALALSSDPQVGPWLVEKLLSSPVDEIQLGCVQALGVLGTKEASEPLTALLARALKRERPDMALLFEIHVALGRIGGPGAEALLRAAAGSADWRLRLAAADVLLGLGSAPDLLDAMRALFQDEVPIVREAAAVAAGARKAEALFPELTLLLREGNLRAKEKAYGALKAISGQDFRYAPEVWEKWWRDKETGRLTEEGKLAAGESISVASFFDFKILSDRVLFIVDVSGSMAWPEYHPNRIETARKELYKAIRSLDEKTYFNVMTFAGAPSIWQKKGEVVASPKNVADALSWSEAQLLPRGGTNTHDTLMQAFEDNPLVDTIYFLSDGMPSTGRTIVPEEILAKVRACNRFRRVIIHCIALVMGRPAIEKADKYEDPDEMADFMRALAEQNGGSCVDIRKPKPLGSD
ncbi:MAG: HEAT repeat domain-containing protein [Planctomycetaceae bacterium]